MSQTIPQQIADALENALQARADVDAAASVKVASGIALAAAGDVDRRAAEDLKAKSDILDESRAQLVAIEEAFLRPGGTLPPVATTPTPAPEPTE